MDETTISLIVSIISLLVASFALILHYKKYQRDKPILSVIPYISSYYIQETSEFNNLKINASFLLNNSGDKATSITESSGFIRFRRNSSIIGRMFRQKGTLGTVEPLNLPVEIKANYTSRISLNYTFVVDNLNALDSCLRPQITFLGVANPPPHREDIILHVNFDFLTTHQQIIKTSCCIFRKDQLESKNPDIENTGLIKSSVALELNEQLIMT